MKKFLDTHTVRILNVFEEELQKKANPLPMDIFINSYYRHNKVLESSDKQIIYQNVYAAIRHKIFLDLISPKPLTWEKRIEMFGSKKFQDQLKNSSFEL